jgi:outer membrane protein assembly factor BamB
MRRLAGWGAAAAVVAWGLAPVTAPAAAAAARPGHENWSMFGHDRLHTGVSPDKVIAASTAPSLTQRWATPVGTSGNGIWGSPAVKYDAKLQTPLVYDVSGGGDVSAFDAGTGALVWRYPLGGGVVSSPTVYGNTLYVGSLDGTLTALNATTGTVQCSFTLPPEGTNTVPGRIWSSPVVGNVDGSGPTVFFGDAGIQSPHEKYNGGRFWAVTGVGNSAGGCHEKWDFGGWVNTGKNGTQGGSWDEPGLVKNSSGQWVVILGSSNPDQAVYALDASDGSLLWRFQTLKTGGDQDVGAGPTISPPGANGFPDGVVYIDGKDRIEYAIDLSTGQQIWSFDMETATGIDANSVAVADLTGNTLIIDYAGSVFSLDATTGAVNWQSTPGGAFLASPVVSGGRGDQAVFAGNLNGTEYGFSLATGALLFSFDTGNKIVASAAVANGILYFASRNGQLYAYSPPPAS